MSEKPTAQAVYDKAFEPGREARSDAYKLGVLTCLRVRIDGMELVKNPYPAGTAESDAYYAGVAEGRALAPIGSAPAGFDDPISMTI